MNYPKLFSQKSLLVWLMAALFAVGLGALPAQAQPFADAANANDNTVSVIDVAGNTMSVIEASPNQFPFLVAIAIDDLYSCDGILISPEWVLTTTSAIRNASFVNMSFGKHYKQLYNPEVVIMRSTEFIFHENWNGSSQADNLALIHLPTPLSLDDKIQPITRLNRTENLTGQAAQSVGWGTFVVDNVIKATNIPQIVDGTIVDIQVAIDHFGQGLIHPGQIAVDLNEATMRTPILITSGPNGWEVVGLHSFGTPSIGAGPEVYSRIAYFADWIQQKSGVKLD